MIFRIFRRFERLSSSIAWRAMTCRTWPKFGIQRANAWLMTSGRNATNVKCCLMWIWEYFRKGWSRARFTNRLYRLKPRASRSKGGSSKLWYA